MTWGKYSEKILDNHCIKADHSYPPLPNVSMPLEETLDTYKYIFSELDTLGLAYINLIRYTPGVLDPEIDGSYELFIDRRLAETLLNLVSIQEYIAESSTTSSKHTAHLYRRRH